MNAKTAETQGLKKKESRFRKAVISPRQSSQSLEEIIHQGYGGRDRTIEIITSPLADDFWAIICHKIDEMIEMLRNKMEYCDTQEEMKSLQFQIQNLRSFKDLPSLILEERKAIEDEAKKKTSSRA